MQLYCRAAKLRIRLRRDKMRVIDGSVIRLYDLTE